MRNGIHGKLFPISFPRGREMQNFFPKLGNNGKEGRNFFFFWDIKGNFNEEKFVIEK